MGQKIDKAKMARIKQQAAKLGTSYYKYIEPFIININDKIGRGSYGQVFKGADIRNGTLIAVKSISISNVKKDPQKFFESLKNEIQIMKTLKNENIVGLHDVKKSTNNIYLFQQLCDRKSLEDILQIRKKIPQSETILIMKQLINGYKYLHSNSVIHRDLKPANILIKDQIYKIADFGFAKYYSQGSQLAMINQSLVGSPIYMCPEILNGNNYSTKSDVWSMGVIIYQMLFGRTPHKANSLQQLIIKVNKKIIRFPQKLNNIHFQNLLQKMLKHSQDDRISWKELFMNEIFIERKEINSIKQSINIAQKCCKNTLDMSTKVNAIYFQDKKILQQIEFINKEENNQNNFIKYHQNQKDLYKTIVNKNQEIQNKKNIIKKIKNWFLFKRNKAVFLNHLSLKIHDCFTEKLLNLPLQKAEIFVLVFAKWQCMIIYKLFVRMKENKINVQIFNEQEYQLFLKSPLKQKMMQKFKNDFTVMKMFFDQLLIKVQQYLQNYQGQLTSFLKLIKRICNQSLCPKEIFSKIYQQTINDIAKICLQSIEQNYNSRQLLQLAYLISYGLILKKNQIQSEEFSMIYDQQIKLTNQQLINIIQNKFKQQ